MNDYVPASVKAASERSDELIKKLNETPNQDGQADITPDTQDKGNTSDDQDAAKESRGNENPVDSKPDDFETKYRTLQGKYNAEIPRLNDQIRTLSRQIDFMSSNQNNQNNQNSNEDGDDNRLDPSSFDEYGDEFASMAKKLNRLIDENATLREQVSNVSQSQGHSNRERYMDTVAKAVESMGVDFNKLNGDPDFLTWLQETIPYTGKARHESLRLAEQRLDVGSTLGIFKEYLGSNPGLSTKKQAPRPKQKQTPNFQPSHTPSGSDVSPPMSRSEKIWTRQDVNQMYRDKTDGKYRGREAEFKALEADMFAAQTEGRFR